MARDERRAVPYLAGPGLIEDRELAHSSGPSGCAKYQTFGQRTGGDASVQLSWNRGRHDNEDPERRFERASARGESCDARAAAPGVLVVLDRDLKVIDFMAFPGEAVDNSIAIGERNGI